MSLIQSFTAFFAAGKFIRKNRLYYFYLVPFLVSLLAYFFLYQLTNEYVTLGLDWVYLKIGINDFVEVNNDSWWSKVLKWVVAVFNFGITIGVFYISMVVSKYILLAALSPWFAFISEKTAQINAGKSYPFSLWQLLKDAWRGVLISLRNFIYEIGLNLIFLLTSLVFPLVAPLTLILNIYIGAYFYGFSMIDYVSERNKIGIKDSIKYVRKHKSIALGIGFGMWLLNLIPIFGLTYGSVNGAVAASLALDKQNNPVIF